MTTATARPTAAPVERTRAAGPLRVAVVGCGAVARASLLPVLAGYDRIRLEALVDRSEERARELADAYEVPRVLADMDALTRDAVDAVVLATPPAHHAPATIALAGRGLHVFVEKPMAASVADAEAMVAAADTAGVVLGVGFYRRFLPSVRLLRHLLATEEYGAPLAVDIEEGGPYGWKLATLDLMTRKGGGGGVLIDIGSHLIDELLHVLPGPATLDSYQDNARGGIETDCIVHAGLETPRGPVPVRLELSRTRDLRNSIRVECEEATLELRRADFTRVVVHRRRPGPDGPRGRPAVRLTAAWDGDAGFIGYQAFRDEIDDWVQAIAEGREPETSGRSVVPVVRLIDECYTRRTDLREPWTDEGLQPVYPPPVGRGFSPAGPAVGRDFSPAGQAAEPAVGRGFSPAVTPALTKRPRVLVTGAGGFLGGRAVEILRERYGWDVVPLVHRPASAARLARWPDDIVLGDVTSPDDMARAVAGCHAVVHCAVGTTWPPDAAHRVTVEGTRTVADAARKAGVRRFVHVSTLFVHRRDGAGPIDETAPLDPPLTDGYGQAKLAAERALEKVAAAGLSTIVIRPTRIYGPFSKTFTVRPLQAMARGAFAVAGGDAPANVVYVDNVVEAIARALEAPGTLNGSAYLVTEPDEVSLAEFFGFFAREAGLVVGSAAMPSRASRQPAGLVRRWTQAVRIIATSPEFRGIVRRVLATDPVGTLPRRLWDRSPRLQSALLRRFGSNPAVVYRPAAAGAVEPLVYHGESAAVTSDKAARELGYRPLVRRERAMTLTLEWARHARLFEP